MATCDIGIVGTGVMGGALALNIADKNYGVALYNRSADKAAALVAAAPAALQPRLHAFSDLSAFVAALKAPRKALVLVPAGPATESAIEALKAEFSAGDVIVDTGNAHYKDQSRRAEELEAAGLRFLAMGISGGEEGARKGPAFFPGGSLSVWDEIRPIIEAASAKASDGRPCVTMNGRGGAGSCVKMFHNAGEYAVLQIWGEVFDILRAGGMDNDAVAAALESFKTMGGGLLQSYMLDISVVAAQAREEDKPGRPFLSDAVLDKIGSKGTGLWSAIEALEVGVPCPSLSAAVLSRQQTMVKDQRVAINAALRDGAGGEEVMAALHGPPGKVVWSKGDVEMLFHAALLGTIASYAQMFEALRALDKAHNFGLNLPATIATFRAGCILQGRLLEPMTRAFEENPDLPNLVVAFPNELATGMPAYRGAMAMAAAQTDVSTPVLSASLAYLNAMTAPVLRHGQLVSLQRDVFGRHGFERVDREGRHNHDWPAMQ